MDFFYFNKQNIQSLGLLGPEIWKLKYRQKCGYIYIVFSMLDNFSVYLKYK